MMNRILRVSGVSLFALFALFMLSLGSYKKAEPPSDDTLRILAIGNSFSSDALETHFSGIAQAAGKSIIVGDMFVSGAPLDLHITNLENDAKAYTYTRIDANGQPKVTTEVALAEVLAAERWDIISLQQVSQNSGLYQTFHTSLPKLLGLVKGHVVNQRAEYVLHQTWAYAENSTHAGFANYNNNQLHMYLAIVDTYNRAAELVDIDTIIPAGTAIQNARTSILGDGFTSDGYHLTAGLGRYIAAATWFEKLTGTSVTGNTYRPQGLTDFQLELGQHAAHFAVQQPNEVTEMVDFQQTVGGGVTLLHWQAGLQRSGIILNKEASLDGI